MANDKTEAGDKQSGDTTRAADNRLRLLRAAYLLGMMLAMKSTPKTKDEKPEYRWVNGAKVRVKP